MDTEQGKSVGTIGYTRVIYLAFFCIKFMQYQEIKISHDLNALSFVTPKVAQWGKKHMGILLYTL